jgi:methionyl-tRNA synthetase
MLMAAGTPLYAHLNVHGYWNMGESKMSKSLGNVIRPLAMKERFGTDGFRYFLLREMAFVQDASFTEDAFVTRYNADLSNGLGNLVSRVLSMQQRYFAGRIQPLLGPLAGDERRLRDGFFRAEETMKGHVERLAFHVALEEIWAAISACDKYIVETSPFKMWKVEDQRARVGEILHVLCDALRHSARLIAPFLPETAARIAALLRVETPPLSAPAGEWGETFAVDHELGAAEPLFPRIDVDRTAAAT